MLKATMDPTQRYFDLIRRIDEDTQRLNALYGKAITCHPGCTVCCVNLTVFPVEFHAIRQSMAEAEIVLEADAFDPSAPCGFLHDGLCRIYPFRPIICRTHGLPIMYLDDTSGEYTWEVSYCKLNFTGCERLEFAGDSLLDIESINETLGRINMDFAAHSADRNKKLPLRIPLKNLCDNLAD